MAQSVKICRYRENLRSKIAKFEWFVEIEPRYTCSSAESKHFTDVCMMGDNTNVYKMSRPWGVISTLALDLLLSNLASLLMLRRCYQRCWLIFAKWSSSKPQQRQSYWRLFLLPFLALLHFDWFKNLAKSCHLSSQLGKTDYSWLAPTFPALVHRFSHGPEVFSSFFNLSSDWSIGLSVFVVIG